MAGREDALRFDPVVCGIDGSPESFEAAEQAATLAPPDARIVLACVTQPAAVVPGWPTISSSLLRTRHEAEEALDLACACIPPSCRVEARLLEDSSFSRLLAEIERERAGLVAVGIHRHSRAAGIALGSVATAMVHDAPCSVLLARAREAGAWPRSIVVGIDGSTESIAALAVARDLATRVGAALTALVALGGGETSVDPSQTAIDGIPLLTDERGPVEALTLRDGDLLVVGGRGLHGLHALGSVSERVAHQARCSVLVVREPPERQSSASTSRSRSSSIGSP